MLARGVSLGETRACTSRVDSDNHIPGGRQRGKTVMPDLLDRLKTALADRYRIERELRNMHPDLPMIAE